MKRIIFIVLTYLLFIWTGCSNDPVNGSDFRIFNGTPVEDLAEAVNDQDTKAIRTIVKSGAPVNYQDPTYGNSVLMLACMHGKKESIQALLENGADPNIRSLMKESSLDKVSGAYMCDVGIVKYMVKHGANLEPNDFNNSWGNPIETTVEHGCREVFHYYVGQGIKIDTSMNSRLLQRAMSSKDLYFLRYLLLECHVSFPDTVGYEQEGTPFEKAYTLRMTLDSRKWYKPNDENYRYRDDIYKYLDSIGK